MLSNETVRGYSKSKGRTRHERRSHARTHRAHRVSLTEVGTSSRVRRPAFAGGCKMENRTSSTISEDRTQAAARTKRLGRHCDPAARQIAADGASRSEGCYSRFDVSPLSSSPLSLPKYVGHQLFQIALGGFKLRRLFVHFHLPIGSPSQGKQCGTRLPCCAIGGPMLPIPGIHTAASYPLPLAFFAPPFFALGTVSAPHRT